MAPALLALWVSLALCVLAIGGAAAFAVVRGVRFWRDLKRFLRVLGAGSDALTARADEAARKAGGAESSAARLSAAAGRLSRSTAYAKAIADAAGDVAATVTIVRGTVPRK